MLFNTRTGEYFKPNQYTKTAFLNGERPFLTIAGPDAKEIGLTDLQIRLHYAQNFTPHKVEYYKERIKETIINFLNH